MPTTFVVNSTFDQPAVDPNSGAETASGAITLRSAIQAANAHPNDASGPDRIEFNIPGTDVHMIESFSLWPAITDPIIIDGYSQPGASTNSLDVGENAVLKINLNDRFGFGGLTISAGNSTVRGLVFTHFNHGLTLTGQGGNLVAGNFFGLPAEGGVSLGNDIAVYVGSGADANQIGGTDPADRNVMSGNSEGIRIVASSDNVIQGNYIGLDTSRNEPLGNGRGGIIVTSGVAPEPTGTSTGNLIGGTVAGARNVISGNGGGILFGGDQASLVTGNLVQGNFIGTDAAGGGNAHFHNNGAGVLLGSGLGANPDGVRMNTIGGTTTAARNVIVNSNTGIEVANGATENLIQGNFIGTDPTGTASFQNSTAGITVRGLRTTIRDNLISGNRNDGILIDGGEITLIQGNRIGTDVNGTSSVLNQNGIHLSGANYTTIGGTTSGAGNVISGNQLSGILLDRSGVGNQIQGNLIGTTANGSDPLGNGVDGILINFNEPGSPSGQTLIGGADPGAGNVIAFNRYNGVHVFNTTRNNESDGEIQANVIHSNVLNGVLVTRGNVLDPHYRISRNSIYSNGRLGIDLAIYDGASPSGDGVTLNDSKGHVGPNNFQNFPVLMSVTASDTATTASGTFQSTPSGVFRLEFFANAVADPSGHGEGQTFLGFIIVATDASGNASFDNVVLPPAPAGQAFVSVTATDGDGNTSEFSGMTDVSQAVADLAISAAAAPSVVSPGGNLAYTFTVADAGPDGADGVAFETAIPANSTFVSLTAPSGWTTTTPPVGGQGSVSATISRFEGSAPAVFTLVVRVDDHAPDNSVLVATGTVDAGTNDPDVTNNTASASASVPRAPDRTDLAVTVSATPRSVRPGEAVTYTVTVTNRGPIDAANNMLAFHLPGGTTFRSAAGPDGWHTQPPSSALPDRVIAETAQIAVGAQAVFKIVMDVDGSAATGRAITGVATIASETLDSNDANNTAEDSASVARADAARVAVAISADAASVTVGQVVTYTITVSNPGEPSAAGVVAHVTLPGTAPIVGLGGASSTPTGADLTLGTLESGASRKFQIQVRPLNPGVLTVTAAATAAAGVSVGPPATVTTDVTRAEDTGTPGGNPPAADPPAADPPGGDPPVAYPLASDPTPPTVLAAVRYGLHTQATLLVVTFSKGMNPALASDPGNYVVLVPVKGATRAVPINRVYYDPQTHEATLLAAKKIDNHHAWQLTVRGNITDLNGKSIEGSGGPGRDTMIRMDLRSLRGRASEAPGATQLGIKALPRGPLVTRLQVKPGGRQHAAHAVQDRGGARPPAIGAAAPWLVVGKPPRASGSSPGAPNADPGPVHTRRNAVHRH